jgi:tetratricopeptide (TPR) repeat protein
MATNLPTRILRFAALLLPLLVAARTPAGVVAVAPLPAPISLTASDGAGLDLVSLTADAVVDDPLAFTELHLTFRNPDNRVREGRFRIVLPPGVTLSRFAMRIGDRWQEGEVVEQQAARVAYEDFLHRRQDPALLENEAGNEFSARVFPIPAAATKEIVVSYSQGLVRAAEPYRLPLRGLPRLGLLRVHVQVGGQGQGGAGKVTELDRHDFVPDRDFEVPAASGPARLGLRDANLVVARVVPLPAQAASKADGISSLYVLVDTSASRALGLTDEIATLEALLSELRRNGDPTITVAAFDQDVAPLWSGKASAAGDLGGRLRARRALGASDLDRALSWLEAEARRGGAPGHARALLVSDGVATAGEIGADKLRARVADLRAAGIERLDALAVGGIRDDVLLSRLVTAGLPRDGLVLDGTQPAATLFRRLTRATRSGLKLGVAGAGWVWPSVLDGIQPGDEVLVYADLPSDRPFRLEVGGVPLRLAGALDPAPRPLLERAWVQARIARVLQQRDALAGRDRDLAEAFKKQVIDLSVQNRVLCPFTSLLVLETEQDYARFGIERRALADIMTVGPAGIAMLHRTEIAAPSPMRELAPNEPAAENISAQVRPMEKDQRGDRLAKKKAGREAEESKAAPSDAEGRSLGSGGSLERLDRNDAAASAPQRRSAAREMIAEAADQAPAPSRPSMAEPPAPAARFASAPASALGPRGGSGHGAGGLAARDRDAGGPFSPAPPPVADVAPATGPLKEVLDLVHAGHAREALALAQSWRERDPGDVLALVALGEAWEALGVPSEAARAYGSIIDLFPGRADMRRFAGERLEHVRTSAALALAIDSYRKSVEQRPDHPAGHRLLGFALLKAGHPREAFEAIVVGIAQKYPSGRFAGVDRILREDLGLAAAAWIRAEPARAGEIGARLSRAGGNAELAPSLRFVLNWETDANDVDFHIEDSRGGHAYYAAPHLPSGGDLYADVTTGYGPECFTIRAPSATRAAPYRLQAHYFSRGPMGYGMGKLEIIEHDGHGNLRFDERPFVIMQDGAFVDLGTVGAGAGRACGVTPRRDRPGRKRARWSGSGTGCPSSG